MKNSRFPWILGFMVLAPGLYWGTYLGLVRVVPVAYADGPVLAPSYAYVPLRLRPYARRVFTPAYSLDRRLLRPGKWDGSTPQPPGALPVECYY